eukprot:TRINITY_DN16756_c0_g2_i1.p1 TRINITY_DN16756_c0_g2~~TRINITY_DN16756_c0_g2_i1.p1  ORF type:complete len:239 (-),score=36.30 TRINITY_DN16756_c0_g2_i1:29-718(-)
MAASQDASRQNLLVSPSMAITLTKSLMGVFVGGVTLWYLVTPYLVQPHEKFNKDFETYVSGLSEHENEPFLIENWTKWKLLLGDATQNFTVDSFHSVSFNSLGNQINNISAAFEWRSEYKNVIVRSEKGLSVTKEEPWYSQYGLYNHYYIQYTSTGGVRYLPRFMFGVPYGTLEELYGGADNIPITGLLSESPSTDRMALQCVMNMVTMTVIFLLYINNPPKPSTKKED